LLEILNDLGGSKGRRTENRREVPNRTYPHTRTKKLHHPQDLCKIQQGKDGNFPSLRAKDGGKTTHPKDMDHKAWGKKNEGKNKA
jgi:hypothetical protein